MTSLVGKSPISLSRIAIYAVLILVCVLYLVPLVVMLLISFKTPEDIGTGNLLSWPAVVTAIGWVKAWDTVDGYFWNSIKITVPAVLLSTGIGALNGYVLSMWRFVDRRHSSVCCCSAASCRSRPCCCRCRSRWAKWAWPVPPLVW